MPIQIQRYTPNHIPAVLRMNARLREGGQRWQFEETNQPDWASSEGNPGSTTWRELFVAVDDDGEVHGGYCLKPQLFRLKREDIWMATWQGPISEGILDRRYGVIGILCVRDMLARCPMQFGWGSSKRLTELLEELGWTTVKAPALVKVLRPTRFLRRASYIRRTRRSRILCDALAWSGLGVLGFSMSQWVQRQWFGPAPQAEAKTVDRFGVWADEIWQAARDHYSMIASRDHTTLNALMPRDRWPAVEIIQVAVESEIIGWAAIRIADMSGDRRFGSQRVGSIIDSLALPGREAAVIDTAVRALENRGVDFIISNYLHPVWRRAFRGCGFLELARRRNLTISPALQERFGPDWRAFLANTHLTPIDADGPHGL
jgi:hypothetical protein